MLEFWYDDGIPTYTVTTDAAGQWSEIVLVLPGVSRPVTLHRDTEPSAVATLIAEHTEDLKPDTPPAVRQHLEQARQVFSIEFAPERLNDSAWELIDLTEAYLARRYDGLVVVADEGIYDENLQLLVSLIEPDTLKP